MEEFKELTQEQFVEFIETHPFEYQTVQKSLCFAIIQRIYRRCKMNYYFDDVRVCCEKGIVVDGNHRYIAYLLAGIHFDIVKWTSSRCDIPEDYSNLVLDLSNDWDSWLYKNRKLVEDGDWLIRFKR